MIGKALLLAGTDTGVGKTTVGLLLAAALQRRGLRVAAMKPVESGCDPGPQDALALGAITGQTDLQQLCPYRLRLPVAPQSAAEAEGRTIELAPIARTLEHLRREADVVLVESAGGLGTPCAPELLVIDLARELELPLLLTARHVLGTVGQVLVALRLMRHEQVRCLGVVLSQTTDAIVGPEAATHAPLLGRHGGGVPLLGILPHVGAMPPDAEALRRWAGERVAQLERALDLSSLVAWIAGA